MYCSNIRAHGLSRFSRGLFPRFIVDYTDRSTKQPKKKRDRWFETENERRKKTEGVFRGGRWFFLGMYSARMNASARNCRPENKITLPSCSMLAWGILHSNGINCIHLAEKCASALFLLTYLQYWCVLLICKFHHSLKIVQTSISGIYVPLQS